MININNIHAIENALLSEMIFSKDIQMQFSIKSLQKF